MASDQEYAAELAALVVRIQGGDPEAETLLCQRLGQGLKLILWRRVREHVEDALQETLVTLIQQIRQGQVREPTAIIKYARTLATRCASRIYREPAYDRADNTALDFYVGDNRAQERLAERTELQGAMEKVLSAMPRLDQEVLRRFYLREQDTEQICRELGITMEQFRVRKTRAKAQFVQIFRRRHSVAVVA